MGHQQAEEGPHSKAAAIEQRAQAGDGEQGAQPLRSSIPASLGVQSSPFAALSGAQAAAPLVATPQLDGAQAAAPEATPQVNGHKPAAQAPPVTEFEEGTSYQGGSSPNRSSGELLPWSISSEAVFTPYLAVFWHFLVSHKPISEKP